MFRNLKTVNFIFIALTLLASPGCSLIQIDVRKDIPIEKKVHYEAAFEKAVKACRDIDLELGQINKDAGQVACNTTYSTFKPYYQLNIFLEKEQDLLKNVDVKVFGGTGGLVPPTNLDANELIDKYRDALKKLSVD